MKRRGCMHVLRVGGGVEVRGSRPLAVSSPLHGPFEADPGGPLGLMRRERRLQHSVQ